MEKLSKILTWPLVALLVGGGAIFAAIAILAPPDARELLFGANGLAMAVIGYLMRSPRQPLDPALPPGARPRPWEQPGFDEEDPTPAMSPRAIDRRDRAPGDSSRPRSKRDGSASPTTLAGILTAVLVAIAVVALSGCGASAVRIHATSATIATQAASAIRAELVRARDAAIAECGARAIEERSACLDEAEERHTAAAIAFDAAVMAIAEYREGIEVAHLAHDQEIAAVVLSRLKSHAVSQIERAIELARASGARVDVGELALASGGAR